MKKLRNIFVSLVAGTVVLFGSCTNLDETPYDFITDDNIDFSDPGIVEEMSGNVYSFLRKTFWTYYGMWDWNEDASDLHMFPSRIGVGWGTYYCSYHKHEFAPSIENINYVIWYHSYVGIMYANKCLSNETFLQGAPQTVAEIRAIRAYFYYILFDSYRNIPILPEGDTPEGFLPEQEAPGKTFKWIEDELNKAIDEGLPETNEFGRPTKYMAYMILAKMHLNYYAWFATTTPYDEGDKSHYEEALAAADKILKCPNYRLSNNYSDNHKQDLSANKEIIFAIDLHPTQATGCYLSAVNLPDMGKDAFAYTGGAWNGGCAIPQFIDTYAHEPVLNADNTPKLDVMGYPVVNYLDTRFYDTWAHGQQYLYGSNNRVSLYGAADNQKDYSRKDKKVRVYYTKEVHSIDNPGAYMLEGYRYIKSEIVSGDKGTFGNDTPVFRLADAYFIAAECALRLGGSTRLPEYTEQKAADLVSEVRARAFASTDPSLATRTVADLKGGSVYDYGVREYTYSGGAFQVPVLDENGNPIAKLDENGKPLKDEQGNTVYEMKDDDEAEHPNFSYEEVWNDENFIKTEEGGDDIELGGLLDDLAWEFVGEFHRRQDLIRFRCANGMNVWNGKSWFSKRAETDPADLHKNIFPISHDNMESNHALVQNPGY